MLMNTMFALLTVSFTPHPSVIRPTTTLRGVANLKQADAALDDDDRPPLINIGSICEFHDPKHGNGAASPVLGVVQTCEHKAKGGMRLTLLDASGASHSIESKAIHLTLPAYKGKETDPSTQLKDYVTVAKTDATELGVDAELLELAWESVSSEERSSFSPKHIMNEIDEQLFKTPVQQYKAFRLLTSDLGKVFFKALSNNKYKPKASKSVAASKDNWCREVTEGTNSADWCFAV
jgi:hypothetical protein